MLLLPKLIVEILIELVHMPLQFTNICPHIFELLVLKIMQFKLNFLKGFLILLVGILNEVVHRRILSIFVAHDPRYLELTSKLIKDGLNAEQILFVLQSYQTQLMIQSELNVIFDLSARHHVIKAHAHIV
jgi:hypothetical protein